MFAPRTLAMGIVSSVNAGRAVYTGNVGAVSTDVRRLRRADRSAAHEGVGKVRAGLVMWASGRDASLPTPAEPGDALRTLLLADDPGARGVRAPRAGRGRRRLCRRGAP